MVTLWRIYVIEFQAMIRFYYILATRDESWDLRDPKIKEFATHVLNDKDTRWESITT